MRIGQLSKETGVSERSLRYYESKNLLQSHRLSSGYREYDADACERVRIIKSCLNMGFSLKDTSSILRCTLAGQEPLTLCADTVALFKRKLQEIDEQIASIQTVRQHLRAMILNASKEQGAVKKPNMAEGDAL